MIILPFGIKNKRATLEKTFAPYKLWDRFNQHICRWSPRVWLEEGSYEGPRKAKQVARENFMFRSKTRFLWSFQNSLSKKHLLYTFYIYTTLCGRDTKMPSQVCARGWETLSEKGMDAFRRNFKNSPRKWYMNSESWEEFYRQQRSLSNQKRICHLRSSSVQLTYRQDGGK